MRQAPFRRIAGNSYVAASRPAAVLAGAGLVATTPMNVAMAAANGPPRKIMWVTHSIGEWNLAVDVGFSDFCEQAGWTYQKVGVPGGSYSAEDNVNQVKLAIQAKPDVIISTITNPAVEAPLVEAEAAGILVILNNSSIEEIRAAHNWGFVGAGGYDQGLIVGRGAGQSCLTDAGKTEGVIASATPNPDIRFSMIASSAGSPASTRPMPRCRPISLWRSSPISRTTSPRRFRSIRAL